MPFTKETASDNAHKRWKNKPPEEVRSILTAFRFTRGEIEMMDDKAKKNKVSRAELIVRAVKAYRK